MSDFDCLESGCSCVTCGWWCSCGCNAPNGACSEASNKQMELMTPKKPCSCGCHNGTVKHVAPCGCYYAQT